MKLRDGGKFITGELDHGTAGIVCDYMDIFGLSTRRKLFQLWSFLEQGKGWPIRDGALAVVGSAWAMFDASQIKYISADCTQIVVQQTCK